ncbi:hypothetical protein [Alkalihalobacillus sp. CinArs1]|uniref:hypothetical protein n=1 Tax=Alkalihalobacillus sp. CinArs1 TaxID=2995314 RepID=UPI0022DCE48B|nr:hypothetical protein [Alkalihalobacillus sp. CinArs1]
MSHFKTRRQPGGGAKFLIIVIIILLLGGSVTIWILQQPRARAADAVREFYKYEQQGNYTQSWNLFHSEMKNRFSDEQYSKLRAQFLTQDTFSKSFTFKVSKMKAKKNWKTPGSGLVLKKVYVTTVTQTFNNDFGKFNIVQEVIIVKEDGKYRILWNYN